MPITKDPSIADIALHMRSSLVTITKRTDIVEDGKSIAVTSEQVTYGKADLPQMQADVGQATATRIATLIGWTPGGGPP